MIKLYPHQIRALEQTKDQNRVAIKGYEGLYEIDREGNVYSIATTRSRRKGLIKPQDNGIGYHRVNLFDTNGKAKKYYIHRLVAETFILNPNNLPEVNHKDGNKQNNSVNNLEWYTSSENQKHAYKNGLQVHSCKLTKTQVENIRSEYVPKSKEFGTVALAEKYDVCQSTIYKIVKGMTYKAGDNYVKD